MRLIHFLAVLICLVVSGQASADRGSIPFQMEVLVFEPVQRAFIGFNGHEEILILSTDLRASKATKVLEVLPLPSKPKISKASIDIFEKADFLFRKKLAEQTRSVMSQRNAAYATDLPVRSRFTRRSALTTSPSPKSSMVEALLTGSAKPWRDAVLIIPASHQPWSR